MISKRKKVVDIEKYNTIDGRPPVGLYEYQKHYLQGLPTKVIMAADTGTGKSFMALAHYDKHAYLKPLLILAPAAKVHSGDWERDVARWFAGRLVPEFEVYSYEKFSRTPTVARYNKTGKKGVWREWLEKYPDGFAVIADEVHKAKNPQSGNGKRLFEVSTLADMFIGLSATPMPNGWIDAANYFKIFGFVKNITDFKKRYVHEQNYKGFPEIIGYYHEEDMQRKWAAIARPLNKQLALDLPLLTTIPVSLDAGKDYQTVIIERFFNDKLLENPSALLHALRQSLLEPKLAWLEDFLEETSDNIVVFYNYQSEFDAIRELIRKQFKGRRVFVQNGQQHNLPPSDVWHKLKRTITLAQYQSGSTAVEMTYASSIVYFSPTYSYSNYEQSIGRINRNGQTKRMTLFLLCAPATVEKDIWAALREKQDFQPLSWAKLQEQIE